VGSLYNEKDPLGTRLEGRFEKLINDQIGMTVSGQDYLENQIRSEDVAKIKEMAQDFYPSDMCVRNIDEFVAINNYLSPHMAYIERVRLLNMLAGQDEYNVHLFTNSDTSDLVGVKVHGPVETLVQMPQVFYHSRINLNISVRSIKTGIPQRVWDVLASKGFLLTNYQQELPEFFEIGKHLIAYESPDELKELVEYYLKHEEERKAIADTGYELVKQKGSVLGRVVEMIKRIG
jgi:spore maturation protein CgeB